jgi:hypothetical protein
MTLWEERIINAFTLRYYASASGAEGAASAPGKERGFLRIRSAAIFPDFENAPPDERESYLEAAESLEKQQLLSLIWVKRRKDETLSSLICRNTALLFELAGRPAPQSIVRVARKAALAAVSSFAAASAESGFFAFLGEKISPADTQRGLDEQAVTDLASLCRALEHSEKITIRALSISIFSDSKRIEQLTAIFNPVLIRAKKQKLRIPDFISLVDRSFPETLIAGKITFLFEKTGGAGEPVPLINGGGGILGLPLSTILTINSITPFTPDDSPKKTEAPTVLMIENKETFYALSEGGLFDGIEYNCCLYTGGHPNRAVGSLVKILAASGFRFYHAGDLDPDGILILQELRETAAKTVTPVRMDSNTFDRYYPWSRKLEASSIKRLAFVREELKAVPELGGLMQRIQETGRGVEQEIIDYRN